MNLKTRQPCLGSYAIPLSVELEVSTLIDKSSEGSQPSTKTMLKSAVSISTQFPTFLCAQYALGSVILNGPAPYANAGAALDKAWTIGDRAIRENKILHVHYSASQGNACLLNAGASLAKHMVLHSDLVGALQLANQVIQWDVEGASEGWFVKAHIEQLMGDQSAVVSLQNAATRYNPMAFYALGLEYLRSNKARHAVSSFQEGLKAAPEVAEIMLGIDVSKGKKKSRNSASAHQYVETFCLPEWSASELDALAKVVERTADSKW